MHFNLDIKHWIADELDLVNCEVRCYDYNVNSFKIDDFLQHIRPLSRMIPHLLRQSGMFSHLTDRLRDSWVVTKVDNAPQSKMGVDYGIFTIKIIEFLVARHDLKKIEDKHLNLWKRELAVLVYNNV